MSFPHVCKKFIPAKEIVGNMNLTNYALEQCTKIWEKSRTVMYKFFKYLPELGWTLTVKQKIITFKISLIGGNKWITRLKIQLAQYTCHHLMMSKHVVTDVMQDKF
jgi:hypothetical protein